MKTTDAARGRWCEILPSYIDPKVLDGKHHKCPRDGSGADRFRFSDQNGSGSYFCACSKGEKGGMALLECCTGRDFKDLAREVDEIIGNTHDAKERKERSPSLTFAERLRPLQKTSKRSAYLEGRGLIVAPGLRFARGIEYRHDGESLGRFDVMLAPITRKGEWRGFHVTYLQDGKKANVPEPRKVYGEGISGGGVELFPAAEEMGVGEGVETCIAASMIFDCPTHAALSNTGLGKWEIPACVRTLHIFADNDDNFAGHFGAYQLAHRARLLGLTVIPHFPPRVGDDWNDVLLAQKRAA